MDINQTANLIKSVGHDLTVIIESSPGVGKSSILKLLANDPMFANHQAIYADCPTMDLPDVQLPFIDGKVSDFAVNAMWGVEDPRPKLIMLDELPKSNDITRLLFTRLLLEHQIGAYKLPQGSVVFATGNRTKDGVGDSFPSHMMNRVCKVEMSKPDVDSWISWAQVNGVDPIVMAWVKQFPHVLEEDNEGNPYIFNPKTNKTSFVSPRSLELASHIVKQRNLLDPDSMHKALIGTIGITAATDLTAYVAMAKELPTWDDVYKDPDSAKVPSSIPAKLIMAYGGYQQSIQANTTAEDIDALAKYYTRMPIEVTAVAFSSMIQNMKVMRSRTVIDWTKTNQEYLR